MELPWFRGQPGSLDSIKLVTCVSPHIAKFLHGHVYTCSTKLTFTYFQDKHIKSYFSNTDFEKAPTLDAPRAWARDLGLGPGLGPWPGLVGAVKGGALGIEGMGNILNYVATVTMPQTCLKSAHFSFCRGFELPRTVAPSANCYDSPLSDWLDFHPHKSHISENGFWQPWLSRGMCCMMRPVPNLVSLGCAIRCSNMCVLRFQRLKFFEGTQCSTTRSEDDRCNLLLRIHP
jgi:hypothetical protein